MISDWMANTSSSRRPHTIPRDAMATNLATWFATEFTWKMKRTKKKVTAMILQSNGLCLQQRRDDSVPARLCLARPWDCDWWFYRSSFAEFYCSTEVQNGTWPPAAGGHSGTAPLAPRRTAVIKYIQECIKSSSGPYCSGRCWSLPPAAPRVVSSL